MGNSSGLVPGLILGVALSSLWDWVERYAFTMIGLSEDSISIVEYGNTIHMYQGQDEIYVNYQPYVSFDDQGSW
jgi:hypothetical protein